MNSYSDIYKNTLNK